MQKQKKQMIVLVILLILLILAYIGVHFYSKKQKERERVFCVQNSNGWEEVQEPEVRSRKHTLTASRQCRRSRTFRKKRKWYWIP